MKFSQTLRNTVRAVSILAIVFVFFHYTLAQDISEVLIASEELTSEILQESVIEVNSETPKVLGESVENSLIRKLVEIVVVEDIKQDLNEVSQEETTQENLEEDMHNTSVEEINVLDDNNNNNSFEESIIQTFEISDEFSEIDLSQVVFQVPQTISQTPIPVVIADQGNSALEILSLKANNLNNIEKISCFNTDNNIDISPRLSTHVNASIGLNIRAEGRMEIGALPEGVNILFSNTESNQRNIDMDTSLIEIMITKDRKSQKGSFTIPILLTYVDESKSSNICQINLIN